MAQPAAITNVILFTWVADLSKSVELRSGRAMSVEVEGALKGFLKGNEKALINYSVDPSIIGGMVRVIILGQCLDYVL